MIHEDLNRRLLWSHCLSNKLRGPDAPVRVADACCGIQSQNFQESLAAFWARIDRLQNDDVSSELRPVGGLVRTWAIRGTMHTIPSKDYYVYVLGGAGERILNWIDKKAKKQNYPPREDREKLLYQPVLDEIKGKAVSEEEIRALVTRRARPLGLKEGTWTGIGDMAFLGLLVHAGKRGSRGLYMRSDDWVKGLKAPPSRQACRAELLRKYIARHGPVSKEDVMYWAYLTRQQLDEALAGLGDEIVEVRMGHSKEPCIDLSQNAEKDFPAAPRAVVLPKYDSLMLSLKDKSRFMDMRYYKIVFGALGMVRPTVLVNGFVAAVWKRITKRTGILIEVHALKKISGSDKKAVEEQFSEYCTYSGLEAPIKWVRARWIFSPSR